MSSVLVIDDEPEILETTRWALETAGYEVLTAVTGEEGLKQVEASHPNMFLVDFKLPRMSGLEFLRQAKNTDPKTQAVMITGFTHETKALEEQCQELGVRELLHKPLQMDKVLQIVREVLGG